MYTVKIPIDRQVKTDKAIQYYLDAHPDADVDEAIDQIFQIGACVMCALAQSPSDERPC
jgi:hypothetical protein